jgi:hypothetical protein
VLALNDAALARLIRAASAVPYRQRAQWLQQLARQVEPPSPGACYTAAWRRRIRDGRILLRLELDEAALVVGLVDAGLLDPLIADDRRAITVAAQQALVQFCDGGEASPQGQRVYDTMRIRLVLSTLKRELRGASRRRLNRSSKPARAA